MKLKQIILLIAISFSILSAISIEELKNIKGINPTPTVLDNYILKKCKETNIPPIIVKAILLKEGLPNHKWKQYSPERGYSHDTIVYHNDYADSYGLGLFQITRKLNTANETEVREIVSNWKYNVDKAFDTLLSKWKSNVGSMTGEDSNPLIIENWYYAIAWYNGVGNAAKQYVDTVYSYMEHDYRVESALNNSDNYSNILSKYKYITNLSDPYIIPTFRGDAIVGHPQVYTLKQIVDNGGKLHIWDKSSDSYREYRLGNSNIVTSSSINLKKGGYYTYSNNPFYPTYRGQCTAFVWGRAYEKLGVEIKFNSNSGRNAKNWWDKVINLKKGSTVKANSIAIWKGDSSNLAGHVAFVEKVENGYVYFNESNVNTYSRNNGNSGGGYDGYEKKFKITNFENRGTGVGKIIGYIYLENQSISQKKSIIDGAGSIIYPTSQNYGSDKDIASMHSHSPTNSTVVFQWKDNEQSCQQLDIFTTYGEDLGKVVVTKRAWDKAFPNTQNDDIFEVSLNSEPFSIQKASESEGWTLISITTTKPLNNEGKSGKGVYVEARCSNSSFKNKDKKTLYYDDANYGDNKLVYLTNNYWWSGNGSIMSYLNKDKYGIFKDSAITYSKHNSLTALQWYVSDNCKKVKIGVQKNWRVSNEILNLNEIKVKKWDDKNWYSTNYCNGKLPCTIDGLNNGFYIIKLKSNAGTIPLYDDEKRHLKAECIQ